MSWQRNTLHKLDYEMRHGTSNNNSICLHVGYVMCVSFHTDHLLNL